MRNWHTKDLWQAILGDLQLQVSPATYETWLRDTEGISFADNLLAVAVPTPFAVEWLERRMYQAVHKTAHRVTGTPIEVHFQVGTAVAETSDDHQSRRHAAQPPSHPMNGKYTFGSFVVGPSNRLPYSAARAVAEAPGRSYNPLFIYSGVGLGKTHLLHAIGHACMSRGSTFMYVTGEQFTNDFISSIRGRTTDDFRERYRSIELLLIDDIQFISGKEQTQESFFHTFNELHNSNRQVVLTSDRPPRALPLLEDRLRSRFEWGLIADVQPPDLETRMPILRNKAERMDVSIEDCVIEYIAKKVHRNVRELEGSLNRAAALARLSDGPITLELASRAIAAFTSNPSARSIAPEQIIDHVTVRFRLSSGDLIGGSKKKEIVRARHVAVYLLHEELGMKSTDIGRLMGGRNHSTIIHALNKINHEINEDTYLRADILAIKDRIFD